MIANKDAIATVAVKDQKVAGKFYEEALGLKRVEGGQAGVLMYRSGNSHLLVYESQYAGTNQATTVTWTVDDVEAEAAALSARGVRFEHYDFPGSTRKGDVHIHGELKNAWFKDPDGNILSIVGR
jgi:catechol 2,3-dioxygenase-like lactoylglutathione lyase family enzyme